MRVSKIFGPPGTGKTTRLLDIMEIELAAGVAPERLAYLSFTVAARKEAKDRAMVKFGFSAKQLKWFRTLHSTAYELLGTQNGTMVATLDEFGAYAGYEFSGTSFTEEGLSTFGHKAGDKLLAFDHFRRHRQLDPKTAYRQWVEPISWWEIQRFTESYERWKSDEGRLDFTDLLERCHAELPCDVVIVDEAQDLSPLQWSVLWRLAAKASRVYLAGDDDQAIYGWAGADPESFLAQRADRIEVLPQSYRCPARVTAIAREMIGRVRARQPKQWEPRLAMGAVRLAAVLDQVELPETGSVLILYRNHQFAASVVDWLSRLGVVYRTKDGSSIPRMAADAIVVWERLRRGDVAVPRAAVARMLTYASMLTIPPSLRALVEGDPREHWTGGLLFGGVEQRPWYDVLDRLPKEQFYLRKIVQRGGVAGLLAEPRVSLSTIHGAKGAEADHVIVLTDMSPKVRRGLQHETDAERRVWYVAITRAKESLTLVGMTNPLF